MEHRMYLTALSRCDYLLFHYEKGIAEQRMAAFKRRHILLHVAMINCTDGAHMLPVYLF